ncbi:universal stress protein [Pontibacter qinzhouensis]|uniref:Universal stress protein n=1 Tax=Pontibacter qinzhouensis TaxID=2603253 RepID=A0A5C8K5H2_9BACT|nr:universal stress protein [Pontibacter qinzhouensis]TXK44296.1 universal stress protein [Pontibacter qinzhouensis]
MRRILVPTDFSEQAQHAFEVAIAIAQKTGATIKLLHALDLPYSTSSFSATGDTMNTRTDMDYIFTLKLLERTKAQMHALIQSVHGSGVEVVEDVDTDHVFSKIKRVIEEDNIDLVVMGSKGASGMNEFLVGSNTEKVVRIAPCPVLTVKKHHDSFQVRDLVLASDFKKEASSAFERFKYFQQVFGAKLHLVYINTPGNFESTENLKTQMQQVADKYKLQNYTISVFNDANEEDGILRFANEIKADMIMMATHGRTGFAHLLRGSIAEDLVNHADLPVLTFHLG